MTDKSVSAGGAGKAATPGTIAAEAPPPAAEGLLAAAKSAGARGSAPVHLWNPPFCGDLDMEIRADGTWFYNGTPIGRPEMVRLFSTILKREEDKYFLVTPVEKVGIRVVDAPFLAVDVDLDEGGGAPSVTFTTNVGERITAGPGHEIRMAGTPEIPRPYLHVRRGLEALIDRKTFYRLADLAEFGPEGRLTLRSGGQSFSLEP
ncbi:DUF1285 domain-containing protein [Paracoccus aminophilus]|uniref:Proteophosphoglycan n=1 Tax=Paracoccus aminophilus JCM 7686 TaxID=1367847 RepID=S5XSR9_PARAH|nr:DUF1285 domain-containing protein [Paracoccus aminophilus]AGT08172.1 hypothetical protein JCM7686_1063 [Paracoccus aminophilus JCM 7686]